jgi:hypothetical protein
MLPLCQRIPWRWLSSTAEKCRRSNLIHLTNRCANSWTRTYSYMYLLHGQCIISNVIFNVAYHICDKVGQKYTYQRLRRNNLLLRYTVHVTTAPTANLLQHFHFMTLYKHSPRTCSQRHSMRPLHHSQSSIYTWCEVQTPLTNITVLWAMTSH